MYKMFYNREIKKRCGSTLNADKLCLRRHYKVIYGKSRTTKKKTTASNRKMPYFFSYSSFPTNYLQTTER